MNVPDGKIKAVQSFIHRLFTLDTETDLLQFICPALSRIVHTDFYGLLIFPNIHVREPLFYTNNSAEFIKAYEAHLSAFDIFTERMITQGNKPAFYRDIVTPALLRKNFFLNECERMRPAKDGCYFPIVIDNYLGGFIAFGRLAQYPRRYSEEELELLAFLVSFLPSGIERALQEPPLPPVKAYLNGFGEILSAGDEIAFALKEVFGPRFWNTPCMADNEKGAAFKTLFERIIADPSWGERGRVVLASSDKNWSFTGRYLTESSFSFRRYFPEKPQIVLTLDRDKGSSPFISIESVFSKYSISRRERQVIHLLYQGKSNMDIADTLHISESTVKHHLYNIYNKTGVDSRTHLIFLLSGRGG